MDFPMYDNARKLVKRPHDAYLSHLQALINERWENSTQTIFSVYQQADIGSDEWIEQPISIDTAIDIGTGFKKGDDFMVFSHKNISADMKLGIMFRTEEDYWICTNTNGYASPTNSCEVRRCNNVMKWVDPETGFVNQQWCAIDYELSSPRPSKDKDIVVADGHIFVLVQGNDLTRSIPKNQRFIFNGLAFKVSAYQTLLNKDDVTFHSNLLYIDMYADPIQPSDDVVNGIANATDYQYNIELQPDVTEQIDGFEGQVVATVTCNDKVVNRDIVWTGNDFVTVDENGSYILHDAIQSLDNESVDKVAIITATLAGNPNVTASCSINIVGSVVSDDDIVIDPLFSEVYQSMPQTFTVYLYKNGVKQDDVFVSCMVAGLTDDYFTLTQNGHNFTLMVKDISSTPLTLAFVTDSQYQNLVTDGDINIQTSDMEDILAFINNGCSKTIDVLLKPFF